MQLHRRDALKISAVGLLAGAAVAQESAGPFGKPTTTFDKDKQNEVPEWAFKEDLFYPPVPRPTFIGMFEQVHGHAVFGPGDSTKIGECFHGIAREWGETPPHFRLYANGDSDASSNAQQSDAASSDAATAAKAWKEKQDLFGTVQAHGGIQERYQNWAHFPIKCYKIPILETLKGLLPNSAFKARMYGYGGMVPGPTLKMRMGQPVVIRYENHLDNEMSVHLHGGHSPSHSDGFPTFYVLQGKARDYFYPNMAPMYKDGAAWKVDEGENQSTMWYHDHAMDATGYNVSKGLAGFAPCFGEKELQLIYDRVLPGYGPHSCADPERDRLIATDSDPDPQNMEDPGFPGFYKHELGKEPYYNPFDIPLVLQDKVVDARTGQIAFDTKGHNGYLGDTFFVNGTAYPKLNVRNRKYRFRLLNGANARIFRLRLMSAERFHHARQNGIDGTFDNDLPVVAANKRGDQYDLDSSEFLRIGKDSWLWPRARRAKHILLAMANRADIVIDFNSLCAGLQPGETREFFLVNTMPQNDGRGPKLKLDDGGDPRVLPLPFDTVGVDGQGIPQVRVKELSRPIALMKFVVRHAPPGSEKEDPDDDREATIEHATVLISDAVKNDVVISRGHRPIKDEEIVAVREFIFERGKGAWQINGRFYDQTIANANPTINTAEEWVLRNGGGGWWHPIHIHLESHQLISYEKDFAADEIVDLADVPDRPRLGNLVDVKQGLDEVELLGLHDTQVLGPNTVVRIRIRTRTWNGPFVFHCHNLEHEDMRMMFNFEPVPPEHDPDISPAARTHGKDLTFDARIGELPWEIAPVPQSAVGSSGEPLISPRPKK